MLNVEDYFEFETQRFDEIGDVESIRFKETRIGLEHVLEPFLAGDSPERICRGLRRSLTLEQVYAAVVYYFHYRDRIEAYLRRGREIEAYWAKVLAAKESPEIREKLTKAREAALQS